jgi:hypothetical protein
MKETSRKTTKQTRRVEKKGRKRRGIDTNPYLALAPAPTHILFHVHHSRARLYCTTFSELPL